MGEAFARRLRNERQITRMLERNGELSHLPDSSDVRCLALRHLRFGWWALLLFASLGVTLEILHGLKIGWYLDLQNQTRRLMWTLAHAHGVLIALVNVVLASTLVNFTSRVTRTIRIGSACLLCAGILVPGGFFLGGLTIYGGDPGLGILVVPVGALLLLGGVFLTAWSTTMSGRRLKEEDKRTDADV
jgi:hypothetical protein